MKPGKIEAIFEWAWECGLNVELSSKSYAIPVQDPYRFPRREKCDFRAGEGMDVEIPVLRFSRGDKCQEVVGTNWGNLMTALEYEHARVFSNLACPRPKFF